MKKYENINGLRAIACLGIVAMHTYAVVEYDLGTLADGIISQGVMLVAFFMLLSGFGLCAGYLDRFHNGTIDLESFYKRRYSKILPFFFLTTVVGVVAEMSLRGVAEGIIQLSLTFGLLPNNSNCFDVNGVCWTLGTIFAFYFIFPAFTVLLKSKRRAWLAFGASLVIQLLCETVFMTEVFVFEEYLNRSNVLYALTFFLTGGLLYLYRKKIENVFGGKNTLRRMLLLAVCIAATAVFFITPDVVYTVTVVDQKATVVFALWCVYAIGAPKSYILNNPLFNLISKYSMEIYLSHMIVLKAVTISKIPDVLGNGAWQYLVVFVITVVGTLVFVAVANKGIKLVTGILKKKKTA